MALAVFVGACDVLEPTVVAPAPQNRPTVMAAPSAPPTSMRSKELRRFYSKLENDLVVRGLLRRDGGGPDTPFNARQLARNFEQVALFDEYGGGTGTLRGRETESTLRRWERPVRMAIEFGRSVPPEQRAKDTAFITHYAERLASATGHPITVTQDAPNYHVFVVGEDDRPAFASRLRNIVPGINPASVETFVELPKSVLCLVFAFPGQGGDPGYRKAVALIRAEHPRLLRESCIHEELAQGLGLANDSPIARPSIFNDDEEFGLLTTHDELLLKLLYDPRLSIGMKAQEARPIIETIAAELTGGPV